MLFWWWLGLGLSSKSGSYAPSVQSGSAQEQLWFTYRLQFIHNPLSEILCIRSDLDHIKFYKHTPRIISPSNFSSKVKSLLPLMWEKVYIAHSVHHRGLHGYRPSGVQWLMLFMSSFQFTPQILCHTRLNLDGPRVAHERSCACLVPHC